MKEDFDGISWASAKEQFAFLALANSEEEAGFKEKTDVLKSDAHSYVGLCQAKNGLVFIKCYQPLVITLLCYCTANVCLTITSFSGATECFGKSFSGYPV